MVKEELGTRLILKEIKKLYTSIHLDGDRHGKPPSKFIIKYTSGKLQNEFKQGSTTLKQWILDNNQLKEINYYEKESTDISGMYYNTGHFYFCMNEDVTVIYLEFILGPLYGRGIIYEIEYFENGGIRFKKSGGTWCS